MIDRANLEKIKTMGLSYKRFGKGRGVHYINAPAGLYIAYSQTVLPMARDFGKCLVPFAWCLKVGDYMAEGRTVGELWQELDDIAAQLELDAKTKRLAVYVEDLSTVFQSLRMMQAFPEVLAKGYNKPLKAMKDNGIEFRSLSDYRGQEEVQNFREFKTDDAIGPDTPLKFEEVLQIKMNACAIVDYVQQHIDIYKGIGRISLTMVARTRGITKHDMYDKDNREAMTKLFKTLELSPETYRECLEALWGGFAYTPDMAAGCIFENLEAYDENSAYLAQMYVRPMPMHLIKTYKEPGPEVCQWIKESRMRGGTSILSIVYLSIDGLEVGEHGIATLLERHAKNERGLECNQGHILNAEHLECWCTNLDLFLIELLYKVDSIKILKAHIFAADLLPNCMIKSLLDKYKIKTMNKGDEAMRHSAIYLDAKSSLGAAFGVHAMNIIKDEYKYTKTLHTNRDGQTVWDWTWVTDKGEEAYKDSKIRKEMEKSRGRFQWLPAGIFIAAWARFCLVSTIYSVCTKTTTRVLTDDTDSAYFYNMTEEARAIIDKYNARLREHLTFVTAERNSRGGEFKEEDWELKDAKGNLHSLGAFEPDGKYAKAKSLHAKCHLFQKPDGSYKLTLAGQPNDKALEYLLEQPDPFAAFSAGLVIPAERSGKYLDTYIESPQPFAVSFKDRDGKINMLIMQHTIARKPISFSVDDVEDF